MKIIQESFQSSILWPWILNQILLDFHLFKFIYQLAMEADSSEDILGPKKRNYDFLQFVRDKKYAEALLIGKQILKDTPDNPSVKKFVEFIEKNAKKLDEMVKEEEQYESAHSSDDSESEEEQETEEKGDKQSSQSEKDSKEGEEEEEQEEEEKPEKKVELSTCTLNPIPHVCPRHHKLIIEAATQGKV